MRESVSTPLPRWASVPGPFTAPLKLTASERLKASTVPAARSRFPVERIAPAVAPSPTTTVPSCTVVPPEKLLEPVSESVPAPLFTRLPDPLIALAKVALPARLKASAAPLPTATSVASAPPVPPAPIWRVPPATVTPPERVFDPPSTSVPAPAFVMPAVPATGAVSVVEMPGSTVTVLAASDVPESVSAPPAST